MPPDAFANHPELRNRIIDPLTSYFRTFRPSDFDADMLALGLGADWRYSDDERETRRLACLGDRLGSDIWVFAYGSLMWNPGFCFAELRRALAPGYDRSFCLLDTFNWRGSPEHPGLMAGLTEGGACQGLVYRISADMADAETEVVWRREAISPAYLPHFIAVETAQGPVEALAFVANPASPDIAHLCHADQVRYLATGRGDHGTSLDYLEGIAAQLTALGIDDAKVTRLLNDAHLYLAAMAVTEA